jgi:hypothetical protein
MKRRVSVIDLATNDTFRPGDVLCSFRKDDKETETKFMELMKAQGMEVWAFSDRGDYFQYLLVPDAEARRIVALNSDRNSLGWVAIGNLPAVPTPTEMVV